MIWCKMSPRRTRVNITNQAIDILSGELTPLEETCDIAQFTKLLDSSEGIRSFAGQPRFPIF